MDPDGSNEAVIVPFKSGQGEYNPTVSPDGTNILFNTYRYGGWKLASFNMDTKEISRFSKSPDYYFNGSYSPDGRMIVYEKVNRGGTTQIFMANENGTKQELLTTDFQQAENRMPVWVQGNDSLLFYNSSAGVNDIYILNVSTKETRNLTKNGSGNDFNPSVSPNGKEVAFFSDRNGYLDVYLMDIAGKNQRLLTEELHNKSNEYNYYTDQNQYWLFKVSWSPDGKSLVFSNADSDNIDLFTINRDGTNLRRITNSSASELTPHWGVIKR